MAEVIGVVSAGIGLTSFALQVAGTIGRLREARGFVRHKAPDELHSIIRRLELLREILQLVQTVQGPSALDIAIENCRRTYSSVDVTLQRVSERLTRSNKSKWKIARHSKSIKDDLGQASQRISAVTGDLKFLIDLLGFTRPTAEQTIDTLHACVSSSTIYDDHLLESDCIEQSAAQERLSMSDPDSTISAPVESPRSALLRERRLDCTVKHCHCSCHRTQNKSNRSWALEYTPLSMLLSGACSNIHCTARRYRWSLHFALIRYGIPFRLQTSFDFISGRGKYSLQPALSLERVVKYTSPGFEALWSFRCGSISLSETQERFRELKRIDSSLKNHVNPGGFNYVKELLWYGPFLQTEQFKLLEFFVHELGMSLENQDQRFLVRCAKWIGEGWHLHLLQSILEYGFDPGCIESPVYDEWPSTCSPNWTSEQFTPDPFFIDYLTILVNASPGFAGSTPLHDIVLLETPGSLASFLSRSALHTEKNFLGQTPLHLAIHNVQIVRLLVQEGHDIDITDNQGISPLMYAAAMGKTDVVELLITQGAKLHIQDVKWSRNFIGFAAARGHWELVIHALSTIRTFHSLWTYQYFILRALLDLISRETWLGEAWSAYFATLVGLMENTNVSFTDGRTGTHNNNLLHYILRQEDAAVLFQHGFTLFNQSNSEGRTPIFSLARVLEPKLTQFLIDHGTDINVVDQQGRTILFSLLRKLSHLDFTAWNTIDSIKVCLREGLDVFSSDDCYCPCSPGGCSLSAAFNTTFHYSTFAQAPSFVWGLEFLSLIEELRSLEDSKRLLLGFMRRAKFEEFELSHVCCHAGTGIQDQSFFPPTPIPRDDIDEVLDEEREFISEFEEDILPLDSGTIESLRSKWMAMLQDRYKKQLEASEEHYQKTSRSNKPTGVTYEVEYKNDTYRHIYDSDFKLSPSVSQPIAEYIIWLEHQYNRLVDSGDDECQRKAWYDKRLMWLCELMQVMQIDTTALVQEVKYKIQSGSWEEPGNPDTERIVEHFLASVKTIVPSL